MNDGAATVETQLESPDKPPGARDATRFKDHRTTGSQAKTSSHLRAGRDIRKAVRRNREIPLAPGFTLWGATRLGSLEYDKVSGTISCPSTRRPKILIPDCESWA